MAFPKIREAPSSHASAGGGAITTDTQERILRKGYKQGHAGEMPARGPLPEDIEAQALAVGEGTTLSPRV
jgi:hypothetical protein